MSLRALFFWRTAAQLGTAHFGAAQLGAAQLGAAQLGAVHFSAHEKAWAHLETNASRLSLIRQLSFSKALPLVTPTRASRDHHLAAAERDGGRPSKL